MSLGFGWLVSTGTRTPSISLPWRRDILYIMWCSLNDFILCNYWHCTSSLSKSDTLLINLSKNQPVLHKHLSRNKSLSLSLKASHCYNVSVSPSQTTTLDPPSPPGSTCIIHKHVLKLTFNLTEHTRAVLYNAYLVNIKCFDLVIGAEFWLDFVCVLETMSSFSSDWVKEDARSAGCWTFDTSMIKTQHALYFIRSVTFCTAPIWSWLAGHKTTSYLLTYQQDLKQTVKY